MFVVATGDSNDTLSTRHYNGDILHEARPSSCEVKCYNKCQIYEIGAKDVTDEAGYL